MLHEAIFWQLVIDFFLKNNRLYFLLFITKELNRSASLIRDWLTLQKIASHVFDESVDAAPCHVSLRKGKAI